MEETKVDDSVAPGWKMTCVDVKMLPENMLS